MVMPHKIQRAAKNIEPNIASFFNNITYLVKNGSLAKEKFRYCFVVTVADVVSSTCDSFG